MTVFSRNRRWLIALLLVAVVSIMGGVGYKFIKSHRPQWFKFTQAAPQASAAIGYLDKLAEDPANSTQIKVVGWALAKDGVSGVELVLNGQFRIPLQTALIRTDVAQAYPAYPDAAKAGFEGVVDTSVWVANWSVMEVVVTDRKGRTSVIGRRTQPAIGAMDTWTDLLNGRDVKRDDIFYFIMATSNVAGGGGKEIDTVFRPYESKTVKVGIRVPILYLRTTKGRASDYAFDADFPSSHKCGTRTIAEDNLNGVIDYAIKHQLPVLFTLNGGIWADAACDAPEWDINDALEQDAANLQWNEKNQVMGDDYLKNLSGSMDSPELGRSLTFNIYAAKNRHYKKRNLQNAASIIRKFASQYPSLFIGVTTDPDVYLNPFFSSQQWYDYNPGTLRQFREWLRGSGPYSGRTMAGEPDLSRYKKERPLTLHDVNALSGRQFKRWEDVDPPRVFPMHINPFWKDAWVTVWEHFRRHLVKLHYDELSQWIGEAGIGKEFIYSAQGFMAPDTLGMPFPIHLDSPARNSDMGGMSVDGAMPSNGHLGAILYGPSAVNQVRMEESNSLFSVFRKLDSDWAVIEHNTADLRNPSRLPNFAEAYKSLREIYNYGAHFISPMAWNGSRGSFVGQPGFVAYTALRDTPLEDAIKNFMISHANLPRRARLWTFGGDGYADDDGWVPILGTRSDVTSGMFTLHGNADGQVSLESPDDLAFKLANYSAIIFKAATPKMLSTVSVEGQTADGKWIPLFPETSLANLQLVKAGSLLPLMAEHDNAEFRRIRLNWKTNDKSPLVLERIAFYIR
ncbi:hypothetical protein [Candidatus Nitrotoga sp. AM1P]|uniref:hypothetical protein n=1 Tax=Candidatus Nitrotoga sp. AM1P TaxID=2559597 RepID=UPI0010AF14CC|nr:hypothetical protein [Candidatus Nitrotoga sp. AM1P]BBJ23408.1 hypothetical protein W01_13350 [Candidatus Nitrotoga sp. AM1P]